jgi:hypothetical protein
MTTAQRSRFYFPAWAAAARVHGWSTPRTILTAQRQPCWASPDLNPLYQRIWEAALQQAAARQASLPSLESLLSLLPDDFRHACHLVAIGHPKSANDLTNDECDRVVALFNLLADPNDLRAVMAWTSPNEARRRRILYWIEHNCVESYVVAVCREKFGTDEPRSLRFEQLRQLHMTLKNRPAARRSSRREEAHKSANQPF